MVAQLSRRSVVNAVASLGALSTSPTSLGAGRPLGPVLKVVGVELPPLIMSTPYGATGILPEICQAAFDRIPIRVEFEVVPWARGFSMLKNGEADALMPTIRSAEREALFDFPEEALYRSEMSFFGRAEPQSRWSGKLAELQSYSFVKLRGALFAPEFDEALREGRIKSEEASSFLACIRMVDARRVDFAAVPKLAGLQIVATEGLSQRIVALEPSVHTQDFFLAFARKPGLAAIRRQFTAALQALARAGETKAIEDGYRKRGWLPPDRGK